MSILGDIFKGGKNILKGAASTFKTLGASTAGGAIGTAIGGPFGGVIGSTIGGGLGSLPKLSPLPGGGGGGFIGGAIGTAIGGAARGVSGIARGASAMCAKYPQWCLGVGGVAAVANLMHSGQLPVPRRRRRRGITARDLASFRRVANLVDHYAKPVHHMRNIKRRPR